MKKETLHEQLIGYLSGKTGRQVAADTRLVDEQVLDSMGFIELVAHVEQEFNVQFEADELEDSFATVEAIADRLRTKFSEVS